MKQESPGSSRGECQIHKNSLQGNRPKQTLANTRKGRASDTHPRHTHIRGTAVKVRFVYATTIDTSPTIPHPSQSNS